MTDRWPTWQAWEDWAAATAPEGVERIEPPTTHRGRKARRTGRAPADLAGEVNGVQVKAECKQHNSGPTCPRFPLSKLKEHQGQALELCHVGGGVAGVLLCFDDVPWWVPWGSVRHLWALVGVSRVGVKTLSVEWLQVHAVPVDVERGWWEAAKEK